MKALFIETIQFIPRVNPIIITVYGERTAKKLFHNKNTLLTNAFFSSNIKSTENVLIIFKQKNETFQF